MEDKVKNDIRKKTGLSKLEDIIKERRLRCWDMSYEWSILQNTSQGFTVGVERIQEEARTIKDKLDGHCETQPEKLVIT